MATGEAQRAYDQRISKTAIPAERVATPRLSRERVTNSVAGENAQAPQVSLVSAAPCRVRTIQGPHALSPWDGLTSESYAAMTITRRRLEEVHSELTSALYRATISPKNTTIVSKELFEYVRLFRAIGPAQLSSLLKNRRLHRSLQELDEAKQDLREETTSTRL